MKSLATLRRVRNDSPVPLSSARGGAGGLGGSGGAPAGDLLSKMGAVPTLFAVVNRTSTAVAALDWHLYRVPTDGHRDPGEDREEITSKHPAVDLWRQPNPFMATEDLVEACQQHLDLVGETILVVTKMGKIPVELWPVRPDRMTPVADPHKFLAGWIYRDPDGGKIPLAADEVIQVKMPNPTDPYRGLGPVQALLADLDSMRYSSEWSRNFFLNSAEPGGIITLPGHLSDPQWDEFVKRWGEQHRGVNRAHRVAVLEYGGNYESRGYSMRDLMFPELRAMNRDTIYEAFGVSKATMGVSDDVNRAAAMAARAQFAELLTTPRGIRWRGALNRQLLPMYEPPRKPGQPVNRTVEFDFDNPAGSDEDAENAERESKANAAATYITAGFSAPSVQEALALPDGMQYGNGEAPDPDRDLMVQLVTAAPAALGPALLPLILPNVEGLEEALKPPAPTPPPGGFGGKPPGQNDPEKDAQGQDGPPQDGSAGGDGKGGKPAGPGAVPPPADRAGPEPVRAAADPGAPEHVDLTELDEAWQRAMDTALGQWEGVRLAWRTDLGKQVRKIVKRQKFAELADLELDSTDGAEKLRVVLADTVANAYAGVVRDAALQGVVIPPREPLIPAAGNGGTTNAAPPPQEEPVPPDDVATTIAALLAAQMALAAGAEAIRIATPGSDADQVAEAVVEFLTAQSPRGTQTAIGGAITGAQNRGRRDAYAAGPVGSLYASEQLDGNTCPKCAEINGRFIATTDDLAPYDALYTAMGGYRYCDGGVRCRGVVTGVWRPDTTTEPLIPPGREEPGS